MLKTVLLLTAFSMLIFLVAMVLMFLSKGVRFKGAHARGEQKSLDKAKQRIKKEKQAQQ